MHVMQKVALILGGNGLIGRTTHQRLIQLDWQTVVIDTRKPIKEVANFRQMDILQRGALGHVIDELKPDLIVNAINIATLYSNNAPKHYGELVWFYRDLYDALVQLNKKTHYLQIGTTGSGGLGFNIPFTHGDKIEELTIIHKAAFAGITTSLLTLLSRSFNNGTQVSEVKPGLAIFDPILAQINFEGTKCWLIDGGESGYYTYNEVSLLTSFMGFTTANTIVDKIIAVIKNKKTIMRSTAFNITEDMNQTVIKQTISDEQFKKRILKKMSINQTKPYLIATGNLGPPSLTRNLLLAELVRSPSNVTEKNFKNAFFDNPSIAFTLRYISHQMPELARDFHQMVTYNAFLAIANRSENQLSPWEIVRTKLNEK